MQHQASTIRANSTPPQKSVPPNAKFPTASASFVAAFKDALIAFKGPAPLVFGISIVTILAIVFVVVRLFG